MGAIAVLITITIMVTRRVMGVTESVNRQWPLAALMAVVVMAGLGYVAIGQFGGMTTTTTVDSQYIARMGTALVDHQGYLVPFEVASVLLLAAMIGSIVVARD
jgi:NADH:ubiquinone oxidoreductase subunit 6 (subunit J)